MVNREKHRAEGMAAYRRYAEIRNKKGLTDYAIAKAAGISCGTLTEWKKGTYVPKLDKLRLIAETLNIPLTDLIGA